MCVALKYIITVVEISKPIIMAYKAKKIIKNHFPLPGSPFITQNLINIPICISTYEFVFT